MKINNYAFKMTTLASLVAAIAITGCGGHSSKGSNNSEAENAIELSGQVIDGYLVNAKVCTDLNRNFKCDENEPASVTDNKGQFKINSNVSNELLKGTPHECMINKTCSEKFPLRVIAFSTENTYSVILGKDQPLSSPVVLSATFFISTDESGKTTTNDEQPRITPYTTLTDQSVDIETVTAENYDSSFSEITESLGVDPQIAKSDYNDPDKVTDESKTALVASEVIARNGLLPTSAEQLEERITVQSGSEIINNTKNSIKEDVKQIVENSSDGDISNIADALDNYSDEVVSSLTMIVGNNSDEFKCGVSKNHNVYCWGHNSWASLGDPAIFPVDEEGNYVEDGAKVKDNFSAKLIKVKTSENEYLSNVKTIDGGNTHVCAVTFEGNVWCWGGNWYGQTGNNTTKNRTMYAQKVFKGQQEIDGNYLGKIESLSLGHNVSCALTKSGEVYCWGENTALQLGDRHPNIEIKVQEGVMSRDGIDMTDIVKAVPTPVKVKFPNTVSGVKELTAGEGTFCALTDNTYEDDEYNVYCWGNDIRGLISHNWMQYQADWLMKYADKTYYKDHTLMDPEGTNNWNWKVTEDSGEFHFLYGQPVTNVKRFISNGDTENGFDLINVTHFGITQFDSQLIVERDNDGELWGSYNHGKADNTDCWRMTDSITTFNGEKIAKLDTNVEDKVSFVLSDKGNLYAFTGTNIYGVFGTGSDNMEEQPEWIPSKKDGSYWVVGPITPDLTGVVDVTVGKRSVCAAVKRTGENSNSANGTDTYCWGSSSFGQLGFDNQDGGFSYMDVANTWTGKDNKNEYFDKKTRIENKPKKVEFTTIEESR